MNIIGPRFRFIALLSFMVVVTLLGQLSALYGLDTFRYSVESEQDLFELGGESVEFRPERYSSPWQALDTNDDGAVDYAVIIDDEDLLLRAAMDFSGDGLFDNFYFYHEGDLVVHEIDSNGDQNIDLRVFLFSGNRIAAFEQDTNHDGYMDLREDYTEE